VGGARGRHPTDHGGHDACSEDNIGAATASMNAPSEYADQMPKLREFAALPVADPLRGVLREELILAFLPVVQHVARRYTRCVPASMEELSQVGTVALINAVDRWDPKLARGEFLGYLIPCVRGEMLRWFRDRTWSMRVPRRLKDLSIAIGRAGGQLSQELGRAPRPSELAARLGVAVQEVIEALDAQTNHHAGALDAVDSHTGIPLIERLSTLDQQLEQIEYRHALRPLLAALPERERMIMTLRFLGELTQTQIAQRLGISQMHVSRLLSRTLKQLRPQLADHADAD
jgi:RNA polymerase sigma-B factor